MVCGKSVCWGPVGGFSVLDQWEVAAKRAQDKRATGQGEARVELCTYRGNFKSFRPAHPGPVKERVTGSYGPAFLSPWGALSAFLRVLVALGGVYILWLVNRRCGANCAVQLFLMMIYPGSVFWVRQTMLMSLGGLGGFPKMWLLGR